MLFAVTAAAVALGCILLADADRRYAFTTDVLVLPKQPPMFNFAKGA